MPYVNPDLRFERSERRGARQFDPSDIVRIRLLYYRHGLTQTEIANHYGASQTVIHQIVKGHTYKDVVDGIVVLPDPIEVVEATEEGEANG